MSSSLKGAGRIEHPRTADVEGRQPYGTRTGGENAIIEPQLGAGFHLDGAFVEQGAASGDEGHLPAFAQFEQMTGEGIDDLVFLGAEHVEVDSRRGEM